MSTTTLQRVWDRSASSLRNRAGWERLELWTGIYIGVDNAAPIGCDVHTAINARVSGNGCVDRGVLMFVIVDANPGSAAIVGTVNPGHARYVGAAIEGNIFLLRRRHAEADVVSRCDL
jgi:hypothetical protein